MQRIFTNFLPRQHGFHFDNQFVNEVILEIKTKGRCGGMAFGALDYYHASLPIPAHYAGHLPEGKLPSSGNRLAAFLERRLYDSMFRNGKTFTSWTEALDHYTRAWGIGVPERTESEIPKLMAALAIGPVPLGLVVAEHVWDIGDNHQVVAYGAEIDESDGTMRVFIYDPNHHDCEVTLTREPGDPHFVSSANGNPVYRGWFVEDYRSEVPSYVDLALSHGVALKPSHFAVGDASECTFTVKNYGEFRSVVSGFQALVDGGKPFDQWVTQFIDPGEERWYQGKVDCMAPRRGRYVVRPTYRDSCDIFDVDIPVAMANGTFDPRSGLAIDINALSRAVLAPPPYLSTVNVFVETEHGDRPLKPCEAPRRTYHGTWRFVDRTKRVLDVEEERFVVAQDKVLRFDLHFSTEGAMRPEKLALRVEGNSGIAFNQKVLLDGSGDRFTGWWKPPVSDADYNVCMVVDGADDVRRFPGRIPDGSLLDSAPASVAEVSLADPPYRFTGYTPGTDVCHTIRLSARSKTLPADRLEPNERFDQATPNVLQAPAAPSGSWLRFPALTLGSAGDVDVHRIEFASAPKDDAYLLDEPRTEMLDGEFLGLTITEYPPSVLVSADAHGCCLDIDIYAADDSGNRLVQSLRGEPQYLLYNPMRVFPQKKFYAVVRNANFDMQGAIEYDWTVAYLPWHLVLRPHSGRLRGLTTEQRRILRRFYEKIDLPRPGVDVTRHAVSRAFPYPPDGWISADRAAIVERVAGVVRRPDLVVDQARIHEGRDLLVNAVGRLAQFSRAYEIKFDADAALRALDPHTVTSTKG